MNLIKNILPLLLVGLTFGWASTAYSQPRSYTAANAHSHNDYNNKNPFLIAFEAGFGSIEVDVFPIDDQLYVAHDKKNINNGRTLKSLYLDPIQNALSVDGSRKFILLVDIKENYQTALPALIAELSPLKGVLRNRQVKIVISGNRPPPGEFKNYPKYIHFDDDQTRASTRRQWKRVEMVSLRFSKLSSWKGIGEMKPEDQAKLRSTIDSVHRAGKIIRFWAAPDNPASWKTQMDMKVDLIGTDKVLELAEFIRQRKTVSHPPPAPSKGG